MVNIIRTKHIKSSSGSSNSSATRLFSVGNESFDEVFPDGSILPTSNLKIFSFAELKKATRNFRHDMVIGEGGFGRVFKGWLDEKTYTPSKIGTGTVIAVMKLNQEAFQGSVEWQSEVNLLGRLSHPNLVKLLGYCLEDKELLLVYEFMQEGSRDNHRFRRGNSATPAIAGGVTAGAAPAIGFAWWRRRKPQKHLSDIPAEEDPEVHLGPLKSFSLRELQVATDSFSNKNILGGGGFSKVYKGRLADGSLVAVKRLNKERTPDGKLQFQTEVEMIRMAGVHRNLIRVRGFCKTKTERLLVYPYMANGSVASCLRERLPSESPLDWPTRKRIALGSARGLSYLHDHFDFKIIHLDVKAANILLDEEFEAVIGDFGFARIMDKEDTVCMTTCVCGTYGHMDPEYASMGKYSEKTDVFAYGIMLLELITGQRACDFHGISNDDDAMLLDRVKRRYKREEVRNAGFFEILVDPDLQSNYVEAEVEQLIQVALLCTQGSSMERPKMSEVVRMLESDGLAEWWDEWQKVEVVLQEIERAPHRNSELDPHWNSDWVVDSTDNLHAVELSGPR